MLRNIRLLYIHNFLTDFLPQFPYQVIYIAAITGSYTVAMSVLSVETLASAFMDIPTGVLSDRLGRRLTMALASLSGAISAVCYASAHSQLTLYAGAFFNGLCQCLFSGNNNALIYESLKTNEMENRFPHYRAGAGSMYQLALALSAFSAIFLSHYGLRFIFWAGVVPQIIAVFVSLMFEEPRVHVAARQANLAILGHACANLWSNPKLMLLMIAKSVGYGFGESKYKFQTAYMNLLWPVWGVGLYRGINHILGFIGFCLGGRIVERFKAAYIFVLRDIYWFLTQTAGLIMNNAITPFLFASAAAVYGAGEVANDHLMQIEFTDEQRATMGSLASFASSVMFAIAAIIIGAVSDRFGIMAGVAVGVFGSVLSLPVYVWLFRRDF